jgi:hypothetical protein
MMQVQTRIVVSETGIRVEIDVLAREDATDAERSIAHAVEKWILGLNQAVAEQSEDITGFQVDYIGPQHALEAQARRDAPLVAAALAWYDAENEATAEHVTAPDSDAEYRAAGRAIQARGALYEAARTYRKARKPT